MRRTTTPRLSEKHVQKQVADFLRVIGGRVYELGHTRSKGRACPHCRQFVPNHDFSTRQTPGLPDLFAVVPVLWDSHLPDLSGVRVKGWRVMWAECKADGGRLSPEQLYFQQLCADTHVWHVVGGLDEVVAFLLEKGVISEKQVNAQRLPAKKAAV